MPGTLFFDGGCGMCTRAVYRIRRLDRTGAVRIEPLQTPGAAELLGIPPTQLLDATRWLDASGAVYTGAEAMNAAVAAAVGTSLPLRIYRLPGIRFVQDALYRWVASHRYRFRGVTPHCESHPGGC